MHDHRPERAFAVAVRLLGWATILASLVLSAAYWLHVLDFQMLRYSNDIGWVSTVVAVPTLALWAAHRVYVVTHRRRWAGAAQIRRAFVFLRHQHAFLGWAALATASAHGLYFVLLGGFGGPRAFTGYVTWLLLLGLVAGGCALDGLRRPPARRVTLALWHLVIAAVFFLGLVLHVR